MQNLFQAGVEAQVRVDGFRRDQEIGGELVRFILFIAPFAWLRGAVELKVAELVGKVEPRPLGRASTCKEDVWLLTVPH